jgi:hypothetical protein
MIRGNGLKLMDMDHLPWQNWPARVRTGGLVCEAVVADGKTCSRCGAFKALMEFYTRGRSGGRQARCRACRADCDKARRASDPEHARAKERARNAKKPETRRDAHRAWVARNPEKARAYEIARYERHREKRLASIQASKARKPETYRAIAARVRHKRRELMVAAKTGPQASQAELGALLISQDNRCAFGFCRRKLTTDNISREHWEAIQWKGKKTLWPNSVENTMWTCQSCNSSKGNRDPHAWNLQQWARRLVAGGNANKLVREISKMSVRQLCERYGARAKLVVMK